MHHNAGGALTLHGTAQEVGIDSRLACFVYWLMMSRLINPIYFFCCPYFLLLFFIPITVCCQIHPTSYTMSNPCETCNKSFGSNHALQQHLRDSPLHRPTFSDEAPQQHRRDSVVPIPTFGCETCNKSFGSNQALQLHLRDSIIHKINHNCETCRKSFSSDDALRQHLRESSVHKPTFSSNESSQQHLRDLIAPKPTFNCETCDENFDSKEAFQQHLQNSREHRLLFDCDTCAQSFSTIDALDQHIQTSPVHSRPPIWCDTCQRSFRSDEALQQHLQSSQIHQVARQHPNIKPQSEIMFPGLHQKVLDAIAGAMNPPKFTYKKSNDDASNLRLTNLIGKFECNNHHRTRVWSSGIVTTVIRKYPSNEYSVVVFNQRCKSCKELGTLFLDEDMYVERVRLRLKRWAGVAVEIPVYDEKSSPPHEIELCEGCKAGYCRKGDIGRSFERYNGET
jgi:hypothetical protein